MKYIIGIILGAAIIGSYFFPQQQEEEFLGRAGSKQSAMTMVGDINMNLNEITSSTRMELISSSTVQTEFSVYQVDGLLYWNTERLSTSTVFSNFSNWIMDEATYLLASTTGIGMIMDASSTFSVLNAQDFNANTATASILYTDNIYDNQTSDKVIQITSIGGDVNFLELASNPTTGSPYIKAAGTDTNIGLGFYTKGTGINYFNNNLGIGTTSPFRLLGVAGSGYFDGNLTTTNLTATGTVQFGNSTTTANNGIDITDGCFAVDGTCVGGGGGASVYTKVYSATLTDVANTSATTSAISVTIPANDINDGDLIEIKLIALSKNNKGTTGAINVVMSYGGLATSTIVSSRNWGDSSFEAKRLYTVNIMRAGNDLYTFNMNDNANLPPDKVWYQAPTVDNVELMSSPGFSTEKKLDIAIHLDAAHANFYFKPQAAIVRRTSATAN